MTSIKPHLSVKALEARYETASEPIGKSHFHAIWLLASGYSVEQVSKLLSFSTRWVKALVKRYNDGGPSLLGDQRAHNGAEAKILTLEALAAVKERIKTRPDDGGLWTGPKIARWLAKFHAMTSVHDQRGYDALVAIGYSIQQPRPRHPEAAGEAERAEHKKNLRTPSHKSAKSIPTPRSKSGRRMNTASA